VGDWRSKMQPGRVLIERLAYARLRQSPRARAVTAGSGTIESENEARAGGREPGLNSRLLVLESTALWSRLGTGNAENQLFYYAVIASHRFFIPAADMTLSYQLPIS
jgi:hypothetical protein